MEAHYESKRGTVLKRQEELYMYFVDMRNFSRTIPSGMEAGLQADYDHLNVSVRGFTFSVKVSERRPYELVEVTDDNAPFHFVARLHFDYAGPFSTDFSIEIDANLNLMMKAMLGSKIKEGLDKAVDALVAMSEGRMPEGMPDEFRNV